MQGEMIFFSSLLKTAPKYKLAADKLFAALDSCDISYVFIEGTQDIWVRDFMPVLRADGLWLSYKYEPSYLDDIPHLRTNYEKDIKSPKPTPCVYVEDLNLDGGNIVFSPSQKTVIISDRVISENPNWIKDGWSEDDIIGYLEQKLGEPRVIMIPALPTEEDMTGHADGMVRFLNENTVLVNDIDDDLEREITTVLENAGLKVVPFPYSDECCYINYLDTEKYIFLPTCGNDSDTEAIRRAEEIFAAVGKRVVPVQIPEILKEGGALNCISWEQ